MGYKDVNSENLSYEESVEYQQFVKLEGIKQFIKLYKLNQANKHNGEILWGDEVEYQVYQVDHHNKKVRLQPNIGYVFENVNQQQLSFNAQLEYGSWMIETVPNQPFISFCGLKKVLQSIQERRTIINSALDKDSLLLSMTSFPMMGVGDFFIPNENLNLGNKQEVLDNKYSESEYSQDQIINSVHPRFVSLTRNIRQRRGSKVNITAPLFKDINTNMNDPLEPYEGQIHMDAMTFGMGMSCLQVTFSSKDLDHARYLYDQFTIISPIFLTLSAATPIFKGKLSNIDTRWSVLSQSVDDRKENERNPSSAYYIPKSRYDSVSYFMSPTINQYSPVSDEYNDIKFPLNQEFIETIKNEAKAEGIQFDKNMINHLAFLYTRDALTIYKEYVTGEQVNTTEHFETIQSTNWNSVRFKPPPKFDSSISWRVEFRPLELQITDEENTLNCFLILRFAKLFYYHEFFPLNFYIPISLVDQNFQRAHMNNACVEQKFFFRKNIREIDAPPQIIELTLKEFFFGNAEFIGLQKLMLDFEKIFAEKVPQSKVCPQQSDLVFSFIKDRVEGKKLTVAQWIRNFVLNHPSYKQDSLLNDEINYDLIVQIHKIMNKEVVDENFIQNLQFD